MTLTYHFKKERLEDGKFVSRPRILVTLRGEKGAIEVPALIDSGCDITVIPENIAAIIGLNLNGKKEKLYAFREFSEAIHSRVSITFVGKAHRQNVTLTIPVLVVLSKGNDDEEGVVLGVQSVFDAFEINFRKVENVILLKPAKGKLFSLF